MFCKFCGNNLENDANFCPKCGKLVSAEAPNENNAEAPVNVPTDDYGNPTVPYNAPVENGQYSNTYSNGYGYQPAAANDEERDSRGRSILTFAIIGLAFASSVYLSFIGLIFSIISRVKLKGYLSTYGETRGTATVGKHLGLVGLIVNIFCMAIAFLLIVVTFMAILGGTDPDVYNEIYNELYF